MGRRTYDLETQIAEDQKLRTRIPANFADWALNRQVKGARLLKDPDSFIWAFPTIITDPSPLGGSTRDFQKATVGSYIKNGTAINANGSAAGFNPSQVTDNNFGMLWNFAVKMGLIAEGVAIPSRLPSVYKSVQATALGVTAAWTPAAGTKFRLMGGIVTVAGTLAAAGVQEVQLRDSATVMMRFNSFFQPTAGAAFPTVWSGGVFSFSFIEFGRISAIADNVLNVNLGTAMATGAVDVNLWGVEEPTGQIN